MLQEDVHRFNQYFMDKEEELVIRLQVKIARAGDRQPGRAPGSAEDFARWSGQQGGA